MTRILHSVHRLSFPLSALLCSVLLLSACDKRETVAESSSSPAAKAVAPASASVLDFVAEGLPYPLTPLEAPATLPGVAPLSEQMQQDLVLRRAFFAQDFARLDPALTEARARGLAAGEEQHATYRFIEGVRETGLAGIDACARWLAELPQSYVAHLACGGMWNSAAWKARGGEYANKVTPARFALMHERLVRSNALLEKALTLDAQPLEALTMLASNHFGLSDRDAAHDNLQRAEQLVPSYSGSHEVRINFTLPEWGGSNEEVAAAIAHAAKLGVAQGRLNDFHDRFVARPWKLSDPGAERDYWEAAIAKAPSFYRLDGLVKYFHRLQNWRDGGPAAARLIEAYPDYAYGYWMRGQSHEGLGRIPEALQDYRAAAARGHDLASQALIQAYVQGGLGLTVGDWPALDAVCRYGATLGGSAAANCLGATFREAASLGAPFRTDIAQSFAWHLLAARAGYHNSQYDLGWLLLSGRAPGVEAEQGKRLGVFWLRRAAELDHQFAKKKLEEAGYPESEPVAARDGASREGLEEAVDLVLPVLDLLL